MSDKKRLTIGVFIGNANSSHSITTLHGIKQAAKETGVNTVVFLGMHTEYKFRDFFKEEISLDYQTMTVFDYAFLSKLDALIISYGELVVFLKEAEKEGFIDKFRDIPKIVLEECVENENTRYQISENYNGMRSVVEHLAGEHGYRHFVCLRGPIDNIDAEERHRAFIDVMNEYNIPVTDDMVRCGDFTDAVTDEIEYLFDHNPRIEAFVCANDTMASAVYKVCKKRRDEIFSMTDRAREWMKFSPLRYKIGMDIESGEGIAVTGYDDAPVAELLDPSLTTVAQNQFATGYKAVYNLLDLVKNGGGESMVLPTVLMRRTSCGCRDVDQHDYEPLTEHERQNPEFYVIKLAEKIKNAIIISDVNEGIGDKIYDVIYDILYADVIIYLGYVKEHLTQKQVIEQLRSLMNGPYSEYISPTALARTFTDFLSAIIRKTEDHHEEVLLTEIMLEGMKYLQGLIYKKATDNLMDFENDTWFMSMITRDMANHVESEKEMFLNAIRKINNLKLGDTYFFTFKDPIVHEENDEWICPKELYLAAYTSADGTKHEAYNKEDRPVLNAEHSFEDFVRERGGEKFDLSLMPIYSDKIQYGLLASDVAPQYVMTFFNVSVQIGTALKYNELSKAQREAQAALESLIKEVEDKNSMLRFISEYDALTDCLNRRGFIERAVNLKNVNRGSRCVAIFTDLDHLKEINDRFGHVEGDFAIRTIADIIRKAVGDNQIIGRLGGDEFVTLVTLDDGRSGEEISADIRNLASEFNETSDKPFYVECSIGYQEFVCEENLEISYVLDLADKLLYESKLKRRSSVCK